MPKELIDQYRDVEKNHRNRLQKLMLYQHVKIFPEVLCHESEQSEESPAEAVKAGVTIVGVPSGFHACKTLWTPSTRINDGKKKQ